ncbi:MAG: hypothetical protein MUE30_14930 [Spirosomaceae bacterium]|jgi:hypothetical protein|nr:hypothetical protein [Spirosomataceae bacterium]
MSLPLFDDATTLDLTMDGDEIALTRRVQWSVADIEQQVALLPYSGENLPKDPAVEKAKLPPFALSFYKFLFFKGRLPTEIELWETYLTHFGNTDDGRIFPKNRSSSNAYIADHVKARLLRSYPSLIRDFHFFLLCQNSLFFESVRYSLSKDYFSGVDLSVQYRGVVFQIAVMLNSERARQYKSQKYTRHQEVPVNEIVMLFDLYKTTNVKGKIKLFSMAEVVLLKEELEKQLAVE